MYDKFDKDMKLLHNQHRDKMQAHHDETQVVHEQIDLLHQDWTTHQFEHNLYKVDRWVLSRYSR